MIRGDSGKRNSKELGGKLMVNEFIWLRAVRIV